LMFLQLDFFALLQRFYGGPTKCKFVYGFLGNFFLALESATGPLEKSDR